MSIRDHQSGPDLGTGHNQPSIEAVDKGNPGNFRVKWAVVDDINIDLASIVATVAAVASVVFLRCPLPVAGLGLAAVLLPLRLLLPRSKPPSGTALITGASSGIGAELSYIMANKGHDLILVGRDREQLDNVKNNIHKLGNDRAVQVIDTDLSVPGAAQDLYNKVTADGHQVDVLVNGAGLGAAGDVLEQPIELAERMITLNCTALVQLTQLFGRDMAKRQRGWMLQISSVGGWIASPHHNLYHASKHFVRAFSEALSVELRGHPGVVNTQLMPGPTHTQFITRAHADETTMMTSSASVEDPKIVAQAGYRGLATGKRMVFSSWNAAMSATSLQLAPRSVHLTMAALMNSPLRGMAKTEPPLKDQTKRAPEKEG